MSQTPQKQLPYQNPDLPISDRVADLISHMTLEEKVAQMLCVGDGLSDKLVNEDGRFDPDKADVHFGNGNGLGQVGRPSNAGGGVKAREHAELTNAIQKYFVEHSRLGIPVIFHEECLHGLSAMDATSFSQPIGLGATFNPDLAKQLFEMTAEEARLRGTHQALTPVVDVAREPRWGRVEETYGEDPYLVARLGIAAVQGLQGDGTFKDHKHLIATLKHFAAHGEPESGTNCAPVNVSERILREVFLYPFREVIENGGVMSIMPSYNEIDGLPSHANKWLLQKVLREEWGFNGFVVSDYYAIRELNERPELYGHHLAVDRKEAALLAAKTGVNIELPEPDCYPYLVQLVRESLLEEAVIDELVKEMLSFKFKLGLFEQPYVDPETADRVVGCDRNRKLALQAARETIVLLQNRNERAPLDINTIKTLAVIGPNADRELLGGYSRTPKHVSTVVEGIKERVGGSVEILYHEGCKITIGGSWWDDEVVLSDPEEDRLAIAEAVKVAEKADVVVLAIGGNEQTSREAWALNHLGDRTDLQMVGRQDELLDAIAATGKPIIVFLFNGRPLAIHNVLEKADAVFECWYLGQEAGHAVAEVLFGDYNPGGKLPITIPRSVGHVPAYYNHKPSARRGYLFESAEPLFAFGYGLSYTRFEFGKPELKDSVIRRDESTDVTVEITNTGPVTGDEVVQMYIRDRVSSVTRPVKELKGFQRITLDPGETKNVTLTISTESLAFYNIDMDYVVEPGEFEIMVGNSSLDEDLQKVTLTVTK